MRSAHSRSGSRRTSRSFPLPPSSVFYRPLPPFSPSSPAAWFTARFWPHENPTPCGHPEDRPLGDGRESGAAARAAQGRGVRRDAGDAVSRHPRAGARQSGRAGRRVALRAAVGGGGGHPAAPRATAPRGAGLRRWCRSAARGEDAPGGAQALGLALDAAGWMEIIGTIAGDDAVLVITKSERARRAVQTRIKELAGIPD